MRKRPGTVVLAALVAALGAAAPSAIRAGDKSADRIDAKLLADQKETALANWKRVFPKENPPHLETDHFLLYGAVEGRTLKDLGATLEKARALAAKVLDLGKEEPWQGKLAVYFAADRRTFAALVRNVEKRRPDMDEHGSARVKSDRPSVIASPGKEAHELSAEAEAAAHIAGALMRAKGGESVPGWVVEGFARATAVRAGTPELLNAEHRRAFTVAVQGKRAAKEAWGSGLNAEAAAVVRGSLMEYLAYSGRLTAKTFHAFLAGFRPPEDGQPARDTDTALAAANISAANLTRFWHNWVRSLR
jgi:hypothetical protein